MRYSPCGFLLLFIFVSNSTAIRLLRKTQVSTSIFDFLLLSNTFYQCSHPTVLNTQDMGITSLQQVEQYCVSSGEQCVYVEWNADTGTAYVCSTRDFIKAEPRLGWFLAVKPLQLSQNPNYDIQVNRQALCDKELDRRTVASVEEAIKRCTQLACGSITINMNKADSLGPTIAPLTTWFCADTASTVTRNGFLTLTQKSSSNSETTPERPTGIKVPCGLNGPVCSNDYVSGHEQGDILGNYVTVR